MSLQAKSLFVSMELSKKNWKLAFGDGARERQRTIPARDEAMLVRELVRAKEKLGLSGEAPVVFGYEAGRDGFWIARMLETHGFEVYVMDPASIEVPRRARQRKTDRLDAKRLLELLVRRVLWGQHKAFSRVCVPSEAQEAEMRVHRERERLVNERGQHRARIRALLALHGVVVSNPARVPIERVRDWQEQPLARPLRDELQREQQRLAMVEEQIKSIEAAQAAALAEPSTPALHKAHKLQRLKGIGLQSSWLLSQECFGWRTFANRKRLGSFGGLAGTPYDSGQTLREQGISKAGSRRVRTTMIELAWGWVRWQPESALSQWFIENYVRSGSKRSRRKGIVAVARKLLIALWKYLEEDELPAGAVLKA